MKDDNGETNQTEWRKETMGNLKFKMMTINLNQLSREKGKNHNPDVDMSGCVYYSFEISWYTKNGT